MPTEDDQIKQGSWNKAEEDDPVGENSPQADDPVYILSSNPKPRADDVLRAFLTDNGITPDKIAVTVALDAEQNALIELRVSESFAQDSETVAMFEALRKTLKETGITVFDSKLGVPYIGIKDNDELAAVVGALNFEAVKANLQIIKQEKSKAEETEEASAKAAAEAEEQKRLAKQEVIKELLEKNPGKEAELNEICQYLNKFLKDNEVQNDEILAKIGVEEGKLTVEIEFPIGLTDDVVEKIKPVFDKLKTKLQRGISEDQFSNKKFDPEYGIPYIGIKDYAGLADAVKTVTAKKLGENEEESEESDIAKPEEPEKTAEKNDEDNEYNDDEEEEEADVVDPKDKAPVEEAREKPVSDVKPTLPKKEDDEEEAEKEEADAVDPKAKALEKGEEADAPSSSSTFSRAFSGLKGAFAALRRSPADGKDPAETVVFSNPGYSDSPAVSSGMHSSNDKRSISEIMSDFKKAMADHKQAYGYDPADDLGYELKSKRKSFTVKDKINGTPLVTIEKEKDNATAYKFSNGIDFKMADIILRTSKDKELTLGSTKAADIEAILQAAATEPHNKTKKIIFNPKTEAYLKELAKDRDALKKYPFIEHRLQMDNLTPSIHTTADTAEKAKQAAIQAAQDAQAITAEYKKLEKAAKEASDAVTTAADTEAARESAREATEKKTEAEKAVTKKIKEARDLRTAYEKAEKESSAAKNSKADMQKITETAAAEAANEFKNKVVKVVDDTLEKVRSLKVKH